MNKFLDILPVFLILICTNVWADESRFSVPTPATTWCDYAGYLDIDSMEAQVGDETAFFDPAGEIGGCCFIKARPVSASCLRGEIYNGVVFGVRVWEQSEQTEYRGNTICLFPGNPGGSTQPSLIPPQWMDKGFFALNLRVKTMGDVNGDCETGLSNAILTDS